MKHKSNDPFAPFQNTFPGVAPATEAFKLWISFFPVAPMFGVRWVFEEAMHPAAQTTGRTAATAAETAAKAAETAREAAEVATRAATEQTRETVEQSAQAVVEAAEAMTGALSQDVARTVSEATDAVSDAVTDAVEVTGEATGKAADEAAAQAGEAAETVAEAARSLPPKPASLMDSAPERPDDLKLIKGIGPGLESKLNGLGIYTFEQIAKFTEDDLVWIDENLTTFKGRCFRDDWVGQAQELRN